MMKTVISNYRFLFGFMAQTGSEPNDRERWQQVVEQEVGRIPILCRKQREQTGSGGETVTPQSPPRGVHPLKGSSAS